ncbi:M48 family metallopeptidase [Luteolibacter ambystomatis]|uniref:M48 family metallopeptidase n=2 Tax=Luteolibacter ambystomatis TaxID=2824561 RepID=A0A975PG09_9BACT|nr:M48 family metallopeptidase [Luteolibacter ambystomatis]
MEFQHLPGCQAGACCAQMMEWNILAVVILISMFALWNLDFAAALLNLKAFPETVPPALADILTAESLDRSRAYLRTNAVFQIIRSSVMLALPIAFWMLGGFQWLDETSRALAHDGPVASGLVFFACCALGIQLLGLPFSWYDTFVIEEKFGFNRSTQATFWGDQIKGLLMLAVLGVPIAAALLWIFLQVPHAWLWAWAVFTVFQLLLTWLAPSLILPLFNKFSPMPEGGLKRRIEELGERCGFPLSGVFVMDGSKRSTKANAFFTGFGKRKKIALFDTLMEKHGEDELLGVLAHEIGHFRLGHIRQRLFVGVLQSAALFFLLGLATDPHGAFSRQLFDAFGVAQISPHVGILLFTLLFEPVSRVLGVLANAWSRRHEFEADAFAANSTGDAKPLSEALKKLSADQLSHPSPHPLRVWLDYSHPPLLQRLQALEKV